jgi:hypothetical protein
MRRVVLKHRLHDNVTVIRTGPHPKVRLVGEQGPGQLCVWVEVDQVEPDLAAPTYSSNELAIAVVGTGWLDSINEMHTHLGSIATPHGFVWHVYLIDPVAARQTLERRQFDAHRALFRTEFGIEIRRQVAIRDRNECRFCASKLETKSTLTEWKVSPHRLEYVVLDLSAPLSVGNVVQACGRCAELKGITPLDQSTLRLRPAPEPAP